MPSKKQKWTTKHAREAQRRAYEIAATLPEREGRALALDAEWGAASERYYRSALDTAGLDEPRIEREVRRLRGLAEGRLVRTTSTRYYVRQPGALDEDFGTPSGARLAASQRLQAVAVTARVVRVGQGVAK